MKRCPQCNNIARDDKHSFCRADGVRLVQHNDSFSNTETIELPLNACQAPTSAAETLDSTVAPTTVLDSARATSPTNSLLRIKKQPLSIVVIVAVVAATVIGSAYYSISGKKNATISSLAVLPFINVNADQQLEYLSDGMTDMLICNLSRLPKLSVKARSSVFRYKGNNIAPNKVGQDLHVQAVLNGRIVLQGDVLTLSLELADASTEDVIWSVQYIRKQGDLASLQTEIARDIYDKLSMKLAGAEEQRLSKNYTSNTQAYQLYLKGRFYWNKRTLADLEQALQYFNEAIAMDPNYALAYSGLADTYVLLPFYRNDLTREATSRAREAAIRGLSIDGDLAEAHATLGFVNTHEYDFAGAEREYKRALQLNPNYATAHQWYGEMLSHLAKHEEALAQLQSALTVDPLSLIINVWYGNALLYARRYGDAIAQLKKTLELDSRFALTHQSLANVYQANGNYAEAAEEFAKYHELTDDPQTAAQIRKSFAEGGWNGFLRTMTGDRRPANLSGYERVEFLAALGEKEKAFAEPDQSYEVFGCVLKVDPLLDPLRGDRRFAELLRRVGFPEG